MAARNEGRGRRPRGLVDLEDTRLSFPLDDPRLQILQGKCPRILYRDLE